MATLEVAQARQALDEAIRCIEDSQREVTRTRSELDRKLAHLQQCRFDEARRRNQLERALAHQQNQLVQLRQIERVLSSDGQQTRFGGSLRELQARMKILRSALAAAPG